MRLRRKAKEEEHFVIPQFIHQIQNPEPSMSGNFWKLCVLSVCKSVSNGCIYFNCHLNLCAIYRCQMLGYFACVKFIIFLFFDLGCAFANNLSIVIIETVAMNEIKGWPLKIASLCVRSGSKFA